MTRVSSLEKKNFLFTLEDILSSNDIPNCFVEDLSSSPIVQSFLDTDVPEDTDVENLSPYLTLNIVRVFNYATFVTNYMKRFIESEDILVNEHQKIINSVYLAILFYFWNYNPLEKDKTITDGVNRFKNYIENKIYLENDSRYDFVEKWVNEFIDINDVEMFIKSIDNNRDISNLSEIHKLFINGLRDSFEYSPIYLANLIESDNYSDIAFNLYLSISDTYRVKTFEEAINIINAYSLNILPPRTEFTRELINLRNYENENPSPLMDPVYSCLKEIYSTAASNEHVTDIYKLCNRSSLTTEELSRINVIF